MRIKKKEKKRKEKKKVCKLDIKYSCKRAFIGLFEEYRDFACFSNELNE
jgi:hypothetical protein